MDINQDKENFVAIEAIDREWSYFSETITLDLTPCSPDDDYKANRLLSIALLISFILKKNGNKK